MVGHVDIKGNDSIKRVYDPIGVGPCLTTMGGGHREPKVLIKQFSQGEGIACCLDANYAKGTAPRDVGKGRRTHILEARACLTPDREKRQEGPRFKDSGQPAHTINTVDRHGIAIYQKSRGNNKGGLHDLSPTLTKNSWEHNNHLITNFRVRKLTPKECWRLQGFPDKAFEKAKEVNSNSQLYKQAGNSVTVNVIKALARELK